jgi:hypothetical protein
LRKISVVLYLVMMMCKAYQVFTEWQYAHVVYDVGEVASGYIQKRLKASRQLRGPIQEIPVNSHEEICFAVKARVALPQ